MKWLPHPTSVTVKFSFSANEFGIWSNKERCRGLVRLVRLVNWGVGFSGGWVSGRVKWDNPGDGAIITHVFSPRCVVDDEAWVLSGALHFDVSLYTGPSFLFLPLISSTLAAVGGEAMTWWHHPITPKVQNIKLPQGKLCTGCWPAQLLKRCVTVFLGHNPMHVRA